MWDFHHDRFDVENPYAIAEKICQSYITLMSINQAVDIVKSYKDYQQNVSLSLIGSLSILLSFYFPYSSEEANQNQIGRKKRAYLVWLLSFNE